MINLQGLPKSSVDFCRDLCGAILTVPQYCHLTIGLDRGTKRCFSCVTDMGITNPRIDPLSVGLGFRNRLLGSRDATTPNLLC